MPPKITDLVKYFEQQQRESSGSRHGSRIAQTRAASTSPVIPRTQDRRVSAPVLRAIANVASLPVLPRSSSASQISTNATINSPLGDAQAKPKPVLLQHAQPVKPAEPQVSQTNVTNIKSGDAARAVLDTLHAGKAGREGDDKTPSRPVDIPPAIRDRFRQPQRALMPAIPEVSTEVSLSLNAKPSRSASQVPTSSMSRKPDPQALPYQDSQILCYSADANEGIDQNHYAPITVRSFDSARTLVEPTNPVKQHSTAIAKATGDASSKLALSAWSSSERPTLPNSQSNGKLSTYTVDVPAHNVFLPDAKPLDLPLLDEYIENLPRIVFSVPEQVMSEAERHGWAEWLAEKPSATGWIGRIRERLSLGKYKQAATRDTEDKSGKPTIQAAKRALIFPPMHRMPPNLTVTNLKHNQTSKASPVTLNTLLSIAINAVLGAQGSSFAVSLMRVEVFRDLIQLLGTGVNFALPSASRITPTAQALRDSGASQPKVIMLSMVPSILGLDFVSAFGKAILWLWLFSVICFIACWEFRGMAGGWRCKVNRSYTEERGEGLDSEEMHIRKQQGWPTRIRQSRAYRTCVVFLITSLYLPLSKISIGALAWTSDYWSVPNYYADIDHPTPDLLGPPDNFRDPLDFCYTTTMRRQGFNWAIPILTVATLTVLIVTIWFPIRLWLVVRTEVPKIDPYTEMGERRKDKKAEYERLLDRDRSPLAFVYNEYRREWAGFKSAYMALKLINVLCITLLTKDNCLFRGRSRDTLNVIRQSTLLGFMFVWMLLQVWARPFIDKLSNNSDWCSRSSYVIIAILGLAAALKLPGQAAYNGWLLVTITVLSFCFNGYFAAIGTGIAQRLIKIWQKRLDFSIDIFSPYLDMPKHIARRIQQETISTLLLAEPEYRLKERELLVFSTVATSDEEECPPYLLAFQGTQGERHIENLKILREVGLQRYVFAAEQLRSAARQDLQDRIMRDYTGPDCFWRPADSRKPSPLASYFGRASIVPFPFTLVFRFDISNTTVSLTEKADLIAYVNQNSSPEVRAARKVRLALRAIDGERCFAPFREERALGRFRRRKSEVSVAADVQYTFCTLHIERNTCSSWRGYNYNSGFKVTLKYGDGRLQRADGSLQDNISRASSAAQIGLGLDYVLSPSLAIFFKNNKDLLDENIPRIEAKLAAHRHFFAREAAWKRHVLSYRFLIDVYGNDQLDSKILEEALHNEQDEQVRRMVHNHRGTITFLRERMNGTSRDVVTQWWYVLWDDVWRRNHNSVGQLAKHEEDFSPAYRTSICYTPMSRAKLREFLDQRGLWPKPRKKGFFNDGVLNRIYFYLDEILFEGTRGGIPLKVGRHRHSVDFHELENLKPFDADDSFGRHTVVTFDTGQGTDHDETTIRNRPRFLFEDIYNKRPASTSFATLRTIRSARERAGEGVRAWLGLSPYGRTAPPPGIYFSLRNVEGTYQAPRGLERLR